MEQRVSLITLGVDDLGASAAFYEALGWCREPSVEGIVIFDLIGQSLGLYSKEELARDMGLERGDIGGFSGVTLAHNVRSKEEVDALMAAAGAAGARILRPASDVFWGGYIGYFADPDGHVWEIAWNPHSPLSETGAFRWRGYGDG